MAFRASLLLTSAVLLCVPVTVGQINSVAGTSQTSFHLDTTRDCNDVRPREIGQSTVAVYGVSSDYQGTPVTSCSLTLSTENIREPYKFKISYLTVQINDPGVNFYVYDGQAGGRLRFGWNSVNKKPSDLDFSFTTGSLVTFKLTKGPEDWSYDISILVEPVPSQQSDCSYGNEYGCEDTVYNYRLLGTKEIAGIVGGCFGLIIIIVIAIVICCYRKQSGIDRRWTEEKLGHVNTAASLHTLNGHVPKSTGTSAANSTKAWTTGESSRTGFASIRRSPNLPRAKIARKSSRNNNGDSSVSDSNASLPVKRPLPPPQVNRGRHETSERSYGRNRRDKYDEDTSFDRSFSTDTKNFSERNYKPPTYREALRYDSESSADEHSFVRENDSHQQTVFIERVIEPSTNKSNKASPHLPRAPPPPKPKGTTASAGPYDTIGDARKKLRKVENKKTEAESEEESDEDNESEEEESEESTEEDESDTESDVSDESEKPDKPDAVYSTPDKKKGRGNRNGDVNNQNSSNVPQAQPVGFRPPNVPPQQFQANPGPAAAGYPGGYVRPGVHQPQPRYGYPGQPSTGQFMQGQPFYPQGQGQPFPSQGQQFPQGHQYPQGQQYPQGHAPQQPHKAQPSSYHQANFTVPMQPQGHAPGHNVQNPNSKPQTHQHNQPSRHGTHKPKPSDPPVYSYLVNRGYQPVEGRHSPMSSSTGASNLSGDRNLQNDDSDFSANLGSGVELMKRKT